jgi:hypothetical protein
MSKDETHPRRTKTLAIPLQKNLKPPCRRDDRNKKVCSYAKLICVYVFLLQHNNMSETMYLTLLHSGIKQPFITGQHATSYKTLYLVTPETAPPISNLQAFFTRIFPAVSTVCHISILAQHYYVIHKKVNKTTVPENQVSDIQLGHIHMMQTRNYNEDIFSMAEFGSGVVLLTDTHTENVRIQLCNIQVTSQYRRCMTKPVNSRFDVLRLASHSQKTELARRAPNSSAHR